MTEAARADSPQILVRLLEQVARGVRSPRAQTEALGLDARKLTTNLQVAHWFGLLEGDASLTPAGLDWVYAGRSRKVAWARVAWSQPWVAELLLAADGRIPPLDAIGETLTRLAPSLAPTAQRAAASDVRALLATLVDAPRPRPRSEGDRQLTLPLSPPPTTTPPTRLEPTAGGREFNPDVYRFVYMALLEYGELGLGQIRALLDRSGADAVPIGGYIDLAIGRGDAARRDDRLVLAPDGIRRRDLAETSTSIVLSDPGYRIWLADGQAAAKGDRAAAVRRDSGPGAAKYKAWDRRLFGQTVNPATLEADLARIVLDRPLDSFPLAHKTEWEARTATEPFLDAWDAPGMAVAAPPYLVQLLGGLPTVNRLLRTPRIDVAMPDLVHRPVVFHAGIVHPSEPVPRTIPDARSLRLRAVLHAPVLAYATALLLLHRHRPDFVDVVRGRGAATVRWFGEPRGGLIDTFAAFGKARGWQVALALHHALRDETLAEILEALGIASRVGRKLTLAERFFVQLGSEPDEGEVLVRLLPLCAAIEAWLEHATPPEEGE